jgi:hypothetical protein
VDGSRERDFAVALRDARIEAKIDVRDDTERGAIRIGRPYPERSAAPTTSDSSDGSSIGIVGDSSVSFE